MLHRVERYVYSMLNITIPSQARSEGGSNGSIEPPSAASSTMYTCNCCGPSCKLSDISVKIQDQFAQK